jgi:hypothetical protein
MTNIFVRIIGEFKDKEFKRADKATRALDKNFHNLRRSATRAFVAVAGISALKRSVKAFAAEDAAVQKLSKSLDNLGLRFESGGVDAYLESLEKATAVTKEQLYPAFQQLANTTLSVTKSQELLNAALDISAGTGKDLAVTVTALSRAFNGNYTSLGKLQTSYTSAQLEAMGFERTVATLSSQFSGAAATAADTYEGKIQKLNIAMGDAAEAIGEGVIDALSALGGGNYDRGLELLATAGEKIGDAFRSAAKAIAVTKFVLTGGLFKSRKEIEAFALSINSAFAPPDAAKQRTYMRERSKYLALERKETAKIAKDRKTASDALKKDAANQKIIAEAQKTFDMERIQIEAALKGKINDVEEYRLKLQRAILNENVDNVIKYSGLLREAEAQAAELADLLARLPEMAENPFTDWPATIARIQYLLKELDWQIPIDVLFAEKGLKLDQDKMTVTKLERMDVQANNVYINGNLNNSFTPGGGGGGTDSNIRKTPWGDYDIRDPKASWGVATMAFKDALETEFDAALAEAESILALTDISETMAELDNIFASLPLTPGGYGVGDIRMREPEVVVNVAGSVIAEADLAQSIADKLYEIQNNGQSLIHFRTRL